MIKYSIDSAIRHSRHKVKKTNTHTLVVADEDQHAQQRLGEGVEERGDWRTAAPEGYDLLLLFSADHLLLKDLMGLLLLPIAPSFYRYPLALLRHSTRHVLQHLEKHYYCITTSYSPSR